VISLWASSGALRRWGKLRIEDLASDSGVWGDFFEDHGGRDLHGRSRDGHCNK
jgi:hypothetical protein